MVKNYFKIACRNLVKNKTFSFINVFGLMVGLTSFLLIALFIFDELTFDSFHKKAAHIYRVIEHETTTDGRTTSIAGAGYQISEKGKTDLPQIKDAVRLITFNRANVATTDNANVFYEDYTTANPSLLTTFDFEFLDGDRNTALTAPYAVIVTAQTALKLFGSTNVVGKSLKVNEDSTLYKITGVLANIPANSHLSFNLLFSEASVSNDDFKKFTNTDWNSGAFRTYLLLNDKTDPEKLEKEVNELVKAHEGNIAKSKITYQLQPLLAVHFHSGNIEGDSGKKGNITYIYVFSILAVFLLFIACINYINLTTARFANRAKEIAIRKVAGASRKNLVGQFLAEAFLVTALAFLLAIITVWLLLPYFNDFTEKQMVLNTQTDIRVWLGVAIVITVVTLLSGTYPALIQSGAKPLLLLKNKINSGKGSLSVRRSLVVFQFAISISMIVATIIIYRQMQFVKTKDMGFNKQQMLVVDINSGKVRGSAETIKDELLKLPQVQNVSVSSRVPGEWKDLPKVKVKGSNMQSIKGEDMYFIGADNRFIATYQLTLLAGRNFTGSNATDSTSVIINETAARALGITAPVGQQIEIPLDVPFRVNVVGIVKDFNIESLRQPQAPLILGCQKNPVQSIDYFGIRFTTQSTGKMIGQMNLILHDIDPGHLFEYHFLDKQWDLFYREDQMRQTIFLVVAILTVLIACLGLFGLATYAAEQRIKEIGIRKVLGASVVSIVTMLSTDFLKLVLIASVIAFPVAGWAMNRWLQDFAYRTTISWWIFLAAAVIAVLIALFTISIKAIKAAISNPAHSLRSE